MMSIYLNNIAYFVPELIIVATMCFVLIMEAAYSNSDLKRGYIYGISGLGLVATLINLVLNLNRGSAAVFTNAIVIDPFSTLSKIMMVLATLGVIYLCSQSKDIYSNLKTEFIAMTLGVLFGGMLLSSANNMLILYLGVETLSILSYVLASFKRNDDRSAEAGLKYALYGGVSAAFMLFGMSHIYGVFGTIQFAELPALLKTIEGTNLFIILASFVVFFVGLGYKISCVPFHMWAPDVYEGSPIPVTTLFALVPKIAGIVSIIRVSMIFFKVEGPLQHGWVGLLSIIAVLTMFVGNISAIGQKSFKRMLAFSSIAHAGNMLLGVVVMNEIGAEAILFYGFVYIFMTLVAFYVGSFVADTYGNDHFERFAGLIKKHPIMALCLTIAMLSLAGMPPFSGFIAKFKILVVLAEKKYYTLAILAGLNSVISLFYYLKVVRLMILKDTENENVIEGFCYRNQAIIIALSIPILLWGVFWEKLVVLTSHSHMFTF
jgi:NADH-quinone oxidoreductase subunit N